MQSNLAFKLDINKRKILNTYDPTHTTTLRNMFVREMNRRFNRLIKAMNQAIVDRDCFGLKRIGGYAAPFNRAFNFPRSQDKVSAFMDWLDKQVKEDLLEIRKEQQLGQAIEQAWTNTYIHSAYQKGVLKARGELKAEGYDIPDIDEQGGIGAVLNGPIHADRLGLLFTRTYSGLKGITDAMDSQISQVLAMGIADGKYPIELAKMLNKTITGMGEDLGITDALGRFIPAKRRAEMLARTEIIRAHNQAILQEAKNWGIEGVHVIAEVVTAGWNVCPQCQRLEGKTFSIDEAWNLIPVHPHCRCSFVMNEINKED